MKSVKYFGYTMVSFYYLALFVLLSSCKHVTETVPVVSSQYKQINPLYTNLRLVATTDTVHFVLNEHTYTNIKVTNLFIDNGREYLSFYDRGSKSINIYDFTTKKFIDRFPLGKWMKSSKLDKAAAHTKNFDSIFITTRSKFFIFDTAGSLKAQWNFDEGYEKEATIESTAPAILKDDILFMGIKPYFEESSLEAANRWNVMYGANLKDHTQLLYYKLPDMYLNGLYGYSYLDYSYCLNDKGNFVFSFPADTNVYETNLTTTHSSYSAKSKFQQKIITPESDDVIQHDNENKYYLVKDSYGPIFYDPVRKIYMRQAKQAISEEDYKANKRNKKRSIIFLDVGFRIIGEQEDDGSFYFVTLLFSSNGNIYARVKGEDEQALHFVRLEYAGLEPGISQYAHH